MKFAVINNHAFPCGCNAQFDKEQQEILVTLCLKHEPKSSPEDDAYFEGYYMSLEGEWLKVEAD